VELDEKERMRRKELLSSISGVFSIQKFFKVGVQPPDPQNLTMRIHVDEKKRKIGASLTWALSVDIFSSILFYWNTVLDTGSISGSNRTERMPEQGGLKGPGLLAFEPERNINVTFEEDDSSAVFV